MHLDNLESRIRLITKMVQGCLLGICMARYSSAVISARRWRAVNDDRQRGKWGEAEIFHSNWRNVQKIIGKQLSLVLEFLVFSVSMLAGKKNSWLLVVKTEPSFTMCSKKLETCGLVQSCHPDTTLPHWQFILHWLLNNVLSWLCPDSVVIVRFQPTNFLVVQLIRASVRYLGPVGPILCNFYKYFVFNLCRNQFQNISL